MKPKFYIYYFLLITIIILSVFILPKIDYFSDDNAIHIAFVGPLTGKDANQGKSMLQAIEIYIDNINNNRDAHDQKIVLQTYDDKNNPNIAKRVAQQIVKSQAVAVIGHRRSDCSIAAGEVYKKYKIPAITPTSSVMKVTMGNKWYFRTFFDNNLQGRLLASYTKQFLLQPEQSVSIFRIDTPYGNELANVFRKTLDKMSVKVKYQWKLPKQGLKQWITDTTDFLQTASDDAGIIFLATQPDEGVKLVKAIREAGIKNILIAPDSYANLHENFKKYPGEKKKYSHYMENLYIAAFLPDVANKLANEFSSTYQEKYQDGLPSAALYAVDAASVIVEGIKQTIHQKQIKSFREKLKEKHFKKKLQVEPFREKLRDTIAGFNNPENAIKGTTGLNYFDENGNIVSKLISIGTYREGHLISARLQLISSDENEQKYKTIVYTGVQFNEIRDIDLKKSTYTPDFYLWFRFKKEHSGQVVKPQNIKFINAVNSNGLGEPVFNETHDGETYLLYKVDDISFKEIYYSNNLFADRHELGISFHHLKNNNNELTYVRDVLGMKQNLFPENTSNNKNMISLTNWEVTKSHFFQNITKENPLGNPNYLGKSAVGYSTFNANVIIGSNIYAYHNLIPSDFATEFFIFTIVVTLLAIILSYIYKKNYYLRLLWFVQVIFALLLIISTENILSSVEIDMETIRSLVITTFAILWWLIPAFLINVAVKRFLWIPLAKEAGRSVPALMRFLVSFIIYCIAVFGIIAFVFKQPTASLFASGGFLAVAFGLAQQTSLANVFSGIALSTERSFRIGDWVKIGNFEDGQVVDINWRTTKIRTGNEYIISIPNTVVSNSDIYNFSYPDNQYWLQFNLLLDPKYDPKIIEEIIIKAIFSVQENIVKDAKPYILLEETKGKAINNLVANYAVFFKTEDYQHKATVLRNVWRYIWTHLSKAGIIASTESPEKPKKPVAFTSNQLKPILTNRLQNMIE